MPLRGLSINHMPIISLSFLFVYCKENHLLFYSRQCQSHHAFVFVLGILIDSVASAQERAYNKQFLLLSDKE